MSYVGKITDTSGNTGLVGSTLYGTCSTGASTAAKVVTCADFDKLITGVTIHVKFSYSNTAANPTLNVNSTGAKNIYYAAGTSGGTVPGTTAATSWYQGAVVSFTYDGTSWYMNDHITGISADAGSATNPVYFSEGQPKACTYSLNKTVPSGAVFTDTNDAVTQTESTTDAEYEVTFAGSTGTTTTTGGVGKSQYFKFNPSKKAFTFGTRVYASTVGDYSVAEGRSTRASGTNSHAEGGSTTASGYNSHAEGSYTTANHKSQHVFGEYNIADPSTAAATARGNYVEIVGNGTSSADSNARTLDWSGNEWLAGSLTIGNPDTAEYTGLKYDGSRGALTIVGGQQYSGAEFYEPILTVKNNSQAMGTASINITPENIYFQGDTWDGTNTSLKDAISSLNSSLLGLVQVETQTLNSTTGYLVTIGNKVKVWFQKKSNAVAPTKADTWHFGSNFPSISGWTARSFNFNAWHDGDIASYVRYVNMSSSNLDCYVTTSSGGGYIGYCATVYYTPT